MSRPYGKPLIRRTPDGREKRCVRCGDWFDIRFFNKHPRGAGGVDNRCRSCRVLDRIERKMGMREVGGG